MPSDLRKERDRERTEQRREALLDAAARVFVRHGYHRALISDIAAEAQVGQGTFYRHFADKRAIFEALLDRFLSAVFEGFSGMNANPPHDTRQYRDASIAAIRRAAQVMERDRALATLLLREAPTVDRVVEEKVHAAYAVLADIAQSFLERAVAEGFARPCRMTVVSQAIVGIGAWMANAWWAGRIHDVSLDDLIRELVDFAFLGIGVAETPSGGESP
jgi:AcrR family transcriptional regulator